MTENWKSSSSRLERFLEKVFVRGTQSVSSESGEPLILILVCADLLMKVI